MGQSYGRIAYEAYCKAEADVLGLRPTWEELIDDGRQRWIAVGDAVAKAALTTN